MYLRIWPLVGLKSLHGNGGAWRLFVLAKNMAGQLDHVSRDELKAQALELGVSEKNFIRWLTDARNLSLVTDVQRMSSEWVLILPSSAKAATLLNCDKLGKPVSIKAELLFKKGWRAYVFASWQSSITQNGQKLVSQKKQAEITGIQPQTQRQFNKQAGVKSQRNYAISNEHGSRFSAVLEHGNRAALFTYWNDETHQKYLGWRLPDSRTYGSDSSYQTPKTMSLFNRTPEQFSATKKALRKNDTEIKEVYLYYQQSKKGNSLWTHLPLK